MYVISINYKNTTADEREKYSFGMEKTLEFLESLKRRGIEEAVYLNTCNRVELYVNGSLKDAAEVFVKYSGANMQDYESHARVFNENESIEHLFQVCAGLKSMVLGEDEILGQMKRAYALARENGYTDWCFNTIFQAAFYTAKKIKTETKLSKTSVSVATIAALKCHNFSKEKKNILVIGATSEIGKTLVKNLLSYGDVNIIATKRNTCCQEDEIAIVDYDNRYQYLDWADIVVSCTKSPHYTINMKSVLSMEISKKSRLFIDLAVPKDIDKDILAIQDTSLITIDEIEELAKENNELKYYEAKKAEEIIGLELNELIKKMCFHDFIPELKNIREKISKDFDKFIYDYRNLASAQEFISFINIIRQMED